MKKTISILSISALLISTAFAADKIVVANAAPTKAVVVKQAAPKSSEKSQPSDYALESFGCCGLPQ
jgi:hypothetical protein